MKYGLFVRGRLVRLTASLRECIASRAYMPHTGLCEVYEFTYDTLTGMPVDARLVK